MGMFDTLFNLGPSQTADTAWANSKAAVEGQLGLAASARQATDQQITDLLSQALTSATADAAPVPTLDMANIAPDYTDVIMAPEPQPMGNFQTKSSIPGRQAEYDQDNQSLQQEIDRQIAAQPKESAGAARVNANTKETGARAVTDPKTGKVTLTNVDDSGNRMPSGNIAKLAAAPTPNSLSSSLTTLEGSTNSASAAGVMQSMRTSLAGEISRIKQEGEKFAENQVGVPGLVRSLSEAEAADRADPAWYPGVGDSPITAQARQRVDAARSAASQVANRFLASNSSLANLTALAANAEDIYKRKQEEFTVTGRRKEAQALKGELKEEEYSELGSAMDPKIRQRLALLNPEKLNSSAKDADFYRAGLAAKGRGEGYVAALNAPEESLPILAMQGNGTALDLLEGIERGNNPSITKEDIAAKLLEVKKLASNEKVFAAAAANFQGLKGDAAKKYGAERLIASNDKSNGKERKAADLQLAWEIYRNQATEKARNNVASWQIPELKDAVNSAMTTTKVANLENVLTAYIGDATYSDAVKKASEFQTYIKQAVRPQAKSIFGMPNQEALVGDVNRIFIAKGWGKEKNVVSKFIGEQRNKAGQVPFYDALINTNTPAGVMVGGVMKGMESVQQLLGGSNREATLGGQ